MTLDSELMKDEYMPEYRHKLQGVKVALYSMAAQTGSFDLIESSSEFDFRGIMEKQFKGVKIQKDAFLANFFILRTEYNEFEKLISVQENESTEHSKHFKLIQILKDLLRIGARNLDYYLKMQITDENFLQEFVPFKDDLQFAILAVKGLSELRATYDSYVDKNEAKIRYEQRKGAEDIEIEIKEDPTSGK